MRATNKEEFCIGCQIDTKQQRAEVVKSKPTMTAPVDFEAKNKLAWKLHADEIKKHNERGDSTSVRDSIMKVKIY